ncbi:AMP-dependent synthetase and ligase family protein isoform 1 [Hibiscus syriacus]|uniref:glucan endo-1,3-beta-D-glucosidase n=1 Tax=Hibiscus syriacus TaxID=106335 RepID=A0A6A2X5C5_HIBSY|nr:AMP-dependent synthetase and ligase family protein isoform 1 [Hibiscus syriacus]
MGSEQFHTSLSEYCDSVRVGQQWSPQLQLRQGSNDVVRFAFPAMHGIKNSLNAHGIKNVKVSTTLTMDVLQTSFPPSSGDIYQIGANIYNAATYDRNLIQKNDIKTAIGTPKSPAVIVPTFIFSLYDESQKTGPETDRHWGMLHTNGTPVYEIDVTGSRNMSDYKPVPPTNNVPYKGKVWCEVAPWVNEVSLPSALSSVCCIDNQTCVALATGGEWLLEKQPWTPVVDAAISRV